eukprot:TRINITY_DN2037_c0_g1_i2.p1 TRINITY_DN2037_c0_g1~~TRINITY_DN2037_c0_g1_i2.p1  ORF type:complete len:653 (-),score=99.99 TRINITY_DN2037_c0_g1_i2:1145-3103(-)
MPLSPQPDRPIPQELTDLINLAYDIYTLENELYGPPAQEFEPFEEIEEVDEDEDDDEQTQDSPVEEIIFEPVPYENQPRADTPIDEPQVPSSFPSYTELPGSFSSGLQYQDVILLNSGSLKATGQQRQTIDPNLAPTSIPQMYNRFVPGYETQINSSGPFYLQQQQYQSALQIFQSNEVNSSQTQSSQESQDFPVFSMPPLLPAQQQYTYSVDQQLQNQSQISQSDEQKLYANLRAFPPSPLPLTPLGQQQDEQYPPIFPMPDPIGGSYPLSQVPGLTQNEGNNTYNLQLFASQNQQQTYSQLLASQGTPIPSQNNPIQGTVNPTGIQSSYTPYQNIGIPPNTTSPISTVVQNPGAQDFYQYQQQNPQYRGGVVAATPLNFGSYAPQIYQGGANSDSIQLPTLPESQQVAACICASDGKSGSVETNRPGCIADEPSQEAFCYVIDPERCENSSRSVRFEGAGWRYCELPAGFWTGLVQEDMDERGDETDEYGIVGQGQEYSGQVQNSPATKDVQEEFPPGCECKRESNPSNSEMQGCFKHNTNDDPYCYVKDPNTCPFANLSKRYTGEAWRYCEIEDPDKIVAQPFDEDEFLQKEACDCTNTGFSGPVDTGTTGCGRYLSLVLASICYVKDPINCPTAIPSTVFPGAAWHTC